MFGQFGWGEMLLLIVVGLFVFGPERLPTITRDASKVLRQLRDTAKGMRDELQAELGPEMADLDLKSLHPRTFVEKHLFGDDEEPQETYQEIVAPPSPAGPSVHLSKTVAPEQRPSATGRRPDATPYDDDAT